MPGKAGGDDEEREEKWHLDRESERRIFVQCRSDVSIFARRQVDDEEMIDTVQVVTVRFQIKWKSALERW